MEESATAETREEDVLNSEEQNENGEVEPAKESEECVSTGDDDGGDPGESNSGEGEQPENVPDAEGEEGTEAMEADPPVPHQQELTQENTQPLQGDSAGEAGLEGSEEPLLSPGPDKKKASEEEKEEESPIKMSSEEAAIGSATEEFIENETEPQDPLPTFEVAEKLEESLSQQMELTPQKLGPPTLLVGLAESNKDLQEQLTNVEQSVGTLLETYQDKLKDLVSGVHHLTDSCKGQDSEDDPEKLQNSVNEISSQISEQVKTFAEEASGFFGSMSELYRKLHADIGKHESGSPADTFTPSLVEKPEKSKLVKKNSKKKSSPAPVQNGEATKKGTKDAAAAPKKTATKKASPAPTKEAPKPKTDAATKPAKEPAKKLVAAKPEEKKAAPAKTESTKAPVKKAAAAPAAKKPAAAPKKVGAKK